jgi:hypothetical protein
MQIYFDEITDIKAIGCSYTTVGRKGIILQEGSQALPVRPSDKIRVR